MIENNKSTEIKDIGEFGLIKRLTKDLINTNNSTIKGVGDDAAVLKSSRSATLVSTDMLVEGVHFDMTFMPISHLGYKVAIVNFSDIYAMNGVPKQLTISLAISSKYTAEALDELYNGIKIACEKHKVDLVGGDTTSSQSGLVISGTVIGECDKDKVVYRSGAKENDLLCVTGDLGGAYLGLLILEREKQIFIENSDIQPDLQGQDYIIGRQIKPEARKDIIEFLEQESILPTSMIDVSDGLASEILHICDSSEVGCSLYEEKIPINNLTYKKAVEFNLNPTTCALNGGEDYELLFTVNQSDHDKVNDNPDISVVGHITDKGAGANLITKDDQAFPLKAQGWDAFLNEQVKFDK